MTNYVELQKKIFVLSFSGRSSLCVAYSPLLLNTHLPDGRQDPAVNQTFQFTPSLVRYVQFQVLDFWGEGGGLQSFRLLEGDLGEKEDINISIVTTD